MGAKRTYWTKMNHDEARLAIDMMDDAEVGRWFRGWIAGAAGKQFDEEKIRSWQVEMRSGFRAGMESFADAQAYSDKQRERVAKRYQQTTETLPKATTVDSGSVFPTKQPTETLPIQQPTTNNEQQEQQHPPNPQRGSSVSMFDSLIPEVFRTTEFVEAWHLWVSDRKDRRKPITIAAATLQMRSLLEGAKTSPEAVRWIQVAISNGWQGLFPPRDGIASNRTASTGTRRSSDEEWKARNAEALKPYTPAPGENHGPAF